MKGPRLKFFAGRAVIVGALVWLGSIGFQESKDLLHHCEEFHAMQANSAARSVKVAGDVVSGSINRDKSPMEFSITNLGQTLRVRYVGKDMIPDTFMDESKAVVEGSLGQDGVFQARRIEAKCASKYEANTKKRVNRGMLRRACALGAPDKNLLGPEHGDIGVTRIQWIAVVLPGIKVDATPSEFDLLNSEFRFLGSFAGEIQEVLHERVWQLLSLLSLVLAVYGLFASLLGAVSKQHRIVRSAEHAALAACAGITLATVSMLYLLLTNDFSVSHVVNSSNRDLPIFYKIAALWGAHDGSLLLWVFVTALFSGVVIYQNRYRYRDMMPYVVAVLMLNLVFFLALNLFLSNPFDQLMQVNADGSAVKFMPADGRG